MLSAWEVLQQVLDMQERTMIWEPDVNKDSHVARVPNKLIQYLGLSYDSS